MEQALFRSGGCFHRPAGWPLHKAPEALGARLAFGVQVVGVNDQQQSVSGQLTMRLLDSRGNESRRKSFFIDIPAYGKCYLPVSLSLPEQSGGYLLLAEFSPEHRAAEAPVISRRYLKVGRKERYEFFDFDPGW